MVIDAVTRATCGVCDWACETGPDRTRIELNRAMIDHYVETGHLVETVEADRANWPLRSET